MNMIHEFVFRGGQTITPSKMTEFRQELPLVLVKAETLFAEDVPHLPEQVKFLARYVEDVLDGVYASLHMTAVTEAIFALDYLLKEVDIIPDEAAGGLCDDSTVIRTVLINHQQEFLEFAKATGLSTVSLAL